jgi:uncharacterized membrane protein YcjF (UPF0283 family)
VTDDIASDIGMLSFLSTMHQTTVRFGTGLWADLEREAQLEGISVAQFVRESAIARLALIESRRQEHPRERDAGGRISDAARQEARAIVTESSAVWSQSRQARERSAQLREQAGELRRARHVAALPSRPPA